MSSRFVPHALTTLLAILTLVRASEPTAAFTPAEGKAPMTVTLVRSDAADCGTHCAEWLALTGLIVPGTPALLRSALDRLGHRSVPVLVDSPGGGVQAAMAMGRMIRARKLDVIVAGTALTDCGKADRACLSRRSAGERPGFVAGGVAACASACALILAAGTERSVGPNSYVGVHQMVTRRTFNRVFNLFRVVRRVVGGHVVEVSRTLISSRPVSSHTVQSAAPKQLYSEVDRYLLGMGIAESIMPLMRSAPPTGIHWMAPVELAMTRIATDTTPAATLVARSAEPGPAVPVGAPAPSQAATLTLGNGRWWNGTVTWRVARAPASASDVPMLVGAIDIPGRNLHGTLSLARNTDPAKGASFIVAVRVVAPPDAGQAELTTVGQPKLCGAEACSGPAIPARFVKLAPGDALFWITAREDGILADLRDRSWLVLPVTLRDGGTGDIGLSLSDPGRTTIADWQRLCCGTALPDRKPDTAPPPAQPPPKTAPWTLGSTASLTLYQQDQRQDPTTVSGTSTWILLATAETAGGPGIRALTGSADLPGAGLRLSFEAGASPVGGAGDLTLELHLVSAQGAVFGPITSVAVAPAWDPSGHVTLLAERIDRLGAGEYRIVLSLPYDGGVGSELQMEFGDAVGHRATLSLPIPGPVNVVLGAAARKASRAGG